MTAFHDATLSANDRCLAALHGLLTPIDATNAFPMLIPAKCATATFSEMELLDALCSSAQPALWIDSKP
ncbi:hypothetical protein ACHHYP_16893 [Achlya hypogyna]|uniref:Uncharacterized protein n=1 Tax=Achlya hypogyna TaxID=1202772 RepID=A0A1V9Y5J0_ACHHY|nr:hypothetical protein ACHHYP_16893 [Achlya hypogyna]